MASLCFRRSSARIGRIRSVSTRLSRSSRPSRYLSFSFAGPRSFDEIIKKELVEEKTGAEVADLWLGYHEGKESMIGLVLDGEAGSTILSRAIKCPFFVQPVFRQDGFFMLVSQFQVPSHFLLAYLEDYRMDPHSATPLLTFSVFNDYVDTKNVSLVRCDILNKNIQDDEGEKVVQSLLGNYRKDDDYALVQVFNERPQAFDIDDFISRMNERWHRETSA